MLTCKDASQLMSQSIDRRLGLIERVSLKFHLLICNSCNVVDKQLEFLHKMCKRIAKQPADIDSTEIGLTNEARERILKELHRKQDGKHTSGN
jgi:hypothetical protein